MSAVPASEHDFRLLPPDKPIHLDNETCLYCGSELNKKLRTKEHVIARRFVPRGTLAGQWNLIAWACRDCNRIKGRLEDVVSAVTMQPNAQGHYADSDERLRDEAQRKAAGSISPLTKKHVAASASDMELKVAFGPGVTMTASIVGPPVVSPEVAANLAAMHCVAFFYLSTYSRQERRGRFWEGTFCADQTIVRSDWGNERVIAFAKRVLDWRPICIGIGAENYFKVAIRRNPESLLWSFALEWNLNYRVAGVFGDSESAKQFLEGLPRLHVHHIVGLDGAQWRMRTEKPLGDQQDLLFGEA